MGAPALRTTSRATWSLKRPRRCVISIVQFAIPRGAATMAAMHRLQTHVRNAFLAGIFAVIPVAVTIFIIYWVNEQTIGITTWLYGRPIPFVGVLVAIAAVYLTGVITSS